MKAAYLLLFTVVLFLNIGCGGGITDETTTNSDPAATIPEDGTEPTLTEEGP